VKDEAQREKYTARSFLSMKNFLIGIYYNCGDLNMDPHHLPT